MDGPFMRPAVLLMDMSDQNLQLAAQCGALDIVAPCPGFEPDDLIKLTQKCAKYGLQLSVIERFVPHDQIVHGLPGRDAQISDIKRLIRSMGNAGVRCLCYNFMPGDDWTRTSVSELERGGALVTAFDESRAPVSVSGHKGTAKVTSAAQLWENLEHFLREVLPVCEESGVVLALHPDDPPLAVLHGKPQIVYSVDQLERVIKLVKSDSNGVCFCQGTFASGGEDIPAAIRRLGGSIKFVHCRDVRVQQPGRRFVEAWQDSGCTDQVAAFQAYLDIGFTGPIRPDHVPTLVGEDNSQPGYHMLGRLWALGWMRGMMQSVAHGRTD